MEWRKLQKGSCLAASLTGTLLVVVASSCSAGSPAGHVSTNNPSPTAVPFVAPGRAVVTLHLDQTTVLAGTPIHGVATVTNRTAAEIAMPGGICNGWLFVGLMNRAVKFQPATGGVGCAPFEVPVGVSKYPITIGTTYQSCEPPPLEPGASGPACLEDGFGASLMPGLPAGSYQTVVVVGRPIVEGNWVTVILTAPRSTIESIRAVPLRGVCSCPAILATPKRTAGSMRQGAAGACHCPS
jgi:hypothetical protein